MALTTFPAIPPSQSSRRKVQFRVLEAQFGDGYVQPVPDGLNNMLETWDLSFDDIPGADLVTIRNYIDGLGGTKFFYWTPFADSTPKKWKVVGEYTINYKNINAGSLQVTIQRVYTLEV